MATVKQPEFGRRLKQLRLDRGVKQTELAGRQVSASYVSRLEAGNRLPSAQALHHLASRLGTTVEELIGDDGAADAERQDFEAAICGLLAQAATALREGDHHRVVEMLEPHAVPHEGDGSVWRWHLLWTLADAYGRMRALPERVRTLRQLLSVIAHWDEDSVHATVLTQLSRDERALGRIDAALEAGEQAVVAARQAPAPVRARALMALIAAETEAGATARAGERVPGLLGLTDAIAAKTAAQAYWTCAGVRVRQGRADEGDQLMQRALATLDSHDDLAEWARLRMAAGALRLRCGRSDGVQEWIDEAATALRLVGGPAQLASLLALTARLHGAEGRFEEARRAAAEAEETGLLSFQDLLRTRLLRAQYLSRLGEPVVARHLMHGVAVEAEEAGCLDLAAEAWKSLATALGETDPATS
ncbi:helix-turn-helix domain-containing protein [Streptomyces physcomitrii]|uniref:Helix-turn-helix transcriptional regulator n=1 Tax=Streptomyces physcomitrii TaxID=2724184 RepID=A0ABX1GYB7_9ACTN|nr:helix-turn-helix transcriptional regulator [Streptomyces physcomitrii]NKI40120.1 helix-turn-helix transcriptional regulator [Streptomyces physcomitrii]